MRVASINELHDISLMLGGRKQTLPHAFNQICDVKARESEVGQHVIVHPCQHQGPDQVWKHGFRHPGAECVSRGEGPAAQMLREKRQSHFPDPTSKI
jgi:hypothetical protein